MAVIGHFTKVDGAFTGDIETLTFKAQLKIEPAKDSQNDKAPDFRVYTGHKSEVGAGWWATSEKTGVEYLSIKLDDPAWAKPVFFALLSADDGSYSAHWSRMKERAK
jgi:uncharacterized protein (DUF736 family)